MKVTLQVLGLEERMAWAKNESLRIRQAGRAWAGVGQVLRQAAMECFRREASPDGVPWEQIKDGTRWTRAMRRTASYRARLKRPATQSKRVQRYAANARILQDTGRLRASVAVESGAQFARIGSALVYARTHQLGLRKKNIPARPFLGLGHADKLKVRLILERYYTGGGWRWTNGVGREGT